MGRVLYECIDEAYLVPEAIWWHFNAMPLTEVSHQIIKEDKVELILHLIFFFIPFSESAKSIGTHKMFTFD